MIRRYLQQAPASVTTLYALVAAFGAYFCMYAFRKPYTAASFDDKAVLVIAQLIGYTLSKGVGILWIPQVKKEQRARYAMILILIAELALVSFKFLPEDLRWISLLINGFPLGFIWGLVFSYLEGRKLTEVLAAGLTISFILSSGMVKSVGSWLMIFLHLNPASMPWITGLIFLPVQFLFIWMLTQIPAPNPEDVQERTYRPVMKPGEMKRFYTKFAPGFLALTLAYMLFTALRDIRENFANEIWHELNQFDPSIFTVTELPTGLAIGLFMALCYRIKDHHTAYGLYHAAAMAGMVIALGSTYLFEHQFLSPVIWMIALGIGIYLAYVTFSSVLFDRIIAAFRYPATAGFMIYVVDTAGYTGSILVMFGKQYADPEQQWLPFFIHLVQWVGYSGIALMGASWIYFRMKTRIAGEPVDHKAALANS
ncbi:MAG: hypothetical protein KDC57_19740 [Saprospiraceae bacterium]|nr:hypothetical protein [Saprospiraceae bacterium]